LSPALGLAGAVPPEVRLLSGATGADPTRGNLLFQLRQGGRDLILKVYRRRRSRWSEFWGDFSQRWIEGKRGVLPERRRQTEADSLRCWHEAGFDVPRLEAWERPTWLGELPALAMEPVPGPTLLVTLQSPDLALPVKQALIARLAEEHGRRHSLALVRGEPLLVQEHPTTRHVLVSGDRLVAFDFENAYRPGFPVPVAIAYELASTLRSLWLDERFAEPYIGVFLDAYAQRRILVECGRLFLSRSPRWRLYRLREQHHRRWRSKTETMRRLAALLGA